MNSDHLAYLINNFNIRKPETYEKRIVFKQVNQWAQAMKQKIDLFI